MNDRHPPGSPHLFQDRGSWATISWAPIALLALLAATGPAAAEDPPAPPAGPAPAGPAPAPGKDADTALLEALVKQAAPTVEKARGAAFKAMPPVAPITREQFLERYMSDMERVLGGPERLPPASRLLARLGVLPEGSDLRGILAKFLEGNIAANYDPMTKRVSFLPGTQRDLATMVHELVHALDDQQFDMAAQMQSWKGEFDRMLAYGALCEGDAMSVQTRFQFHGETAKQPLDQLRGMADATATMILQGRYGATPPGIVLAFKSQYTEGLVFAETLRRTEKGEAAIDAAFRAPPISTEQILHPEKYLAGEAPVVLDLPKPEGDGKTLFTTTLGELGARVVLLSRGAKRADAGNAAAGWAGDSVALVAFPSGEAVVWVTTWDSEKDATEFVDAMKSAFPLGSAAEGAPQRGILQRGPRVEFVEAPLDALADAVAMAKATAAAGR